MYPINPPAKPPSRMPTNATTRAARGGERTGALAARAARRPRRCHASDAATIRRSAVRGGRGRPDLQRGGQHRDAVSAASAPSLPDASRSWWSTTAAPTARPSSRAQLGERARRHRRDRARPARPASVRRTAPGSARAIERGADVCVQIDADLSHDPAVLPALVANIEHGADLAIGSRYVPGGVTENWPWRRRCAVAVGQPLRGRRARAGRQRRHGRLPRLPVDALARMDYRDGHRRGLRLPDRDDAPARARRRQDRRVPDHVPRARRRRVEDVAAGSSARPFVLVGATVAADATRRGRRQRRRRRAV